MNVKKEESVTTRVWRIVKAMGSGAEFGSSQLYLSNNDMPFGSITAALSQLAKRGIIKAVGKSAGKELIWKVTSKGARIKVVARARPAPYKRKPKNGVPPIVAEAPAMEVGDHVSIGGVMHEITDSGSMQDGRVTWHGIERPEALKQPPHLPTPEQSWIPEHALPRKTSSIADNIVDEILGMLGELAALSKIPPLQRFSTRELLQEVARREQAGQL